MSMKGLFDLSLYESQSDDDILGLALDEGTSEFDSRCGCPAHPDSDIDKDTTAAKETSISVPSGVELDEDTYNASIKALKQSFKEAYDIMGILEKCKVSGKTASQRQAEFTEAAIDDAVYESYCSGPLFEAVDRADKEKVKSIINTIRPKIEKFTFDDRVEFYKPSKWIRLIMSVQWWETRFWQVAGALCMEQNNIDDYVKRLSAEFSDDLGEYKIIAARVPPSIFDLFRTKFNWKNMKRAYFLLIDKKMPSELKAAMKELDKAAKTDSSNNVVVKECVIDYDD